MIYYMRSETGKCIQNPFIYGASRMGEVSCSCAQFSNSVCPPTFSFNDTSFKADRVKCGNGKEYPEIDWGSLNITVISKG